MRPWTILITIGLLCLILSACGQKGPLKPASGDTRTTFHNHIS
ncbi:MAG: lipoprotein [Candidatus Thiodiazotropha sp.]